MYALGGRLDWHIREIFKKLRREKLNKGLRKLGWLVGVCIGRIFGHSVTTYLPGRR